MQTLANATLGCFDSQKGQRKQTMYEIDFTGVGMCTRARQRLPSPRQSELQNKTERGREKPPRCLFQGHSVCSRALLNKEHAGGVARLGRTQRSSASGGWRIQQAPYDKVGIPPPEVLPLALHRKFHQRPKPTARVSATGWCNPHKTPIPSWHRTRTPSGFGHFEYIRRCA